MESIINREIKVNFKSFLIWFLVIASLGAMTILMFPAMQQSSKEMLTVLETMPKELLQAFGYDASTFNNVTNFYATKGYSSIALFFTIYAAILGGNIIAKEESDGTSEYLLSKPVERKKIIQSKKIATLFYIVLISLTWYILSIILFKIVDEVDLKALSLLTLLPLLGSITFASITMLIGAATKKARKVTTLAIGIVMGSYVIQIISLLGEKLEFLKYFSIFEYINSKPIIDSYEVKYFYILIMIGIIVVTNIMSTKTFTSKDISV